MALTKNNENKFTKSNQVSKDKFILGSSECYFEPAQAYNGVLTPEKLAKMLLNQSTVDGVSCVIGETGGEGKSLKLTYFRKHSNGETVTEEVQHVGLITASDYKMQLSESHIAEIQNHVRNEQIVKRTDAKSVLDMF